VSSNPPEGWQEWDPCCSDNNRPVECGNCDWKGRENDISDGIWGINDIYERIDAGSVVPVGVCPAVHSCSKDGDYPCGSLVYFSDVEMVYRRVPNVLEKIVEATK
jgi:hypothetical protein